MQPHLPWQKYDSLLSLATSDISQSSLYPNDLVSRAIIDDALDWCARYGKLWIFDFHNESTESEYFSRSLQPSLRRSAYAALLPDLFGLENEAIVVGLREGNNFKNYRNGPLLTSAWVLFASPRESDYECGMESLWNAAYYTFFIFFGKSSWENMPLKFFTFFSFLTRSKFDKVSLGLYFIILKLSSALELPSELVTFFFQILYR